MSNPFAFPDAVIFVDGDLELRHLGNDPRPAIFIADTSFLDAVVSVDRQMFSQEYAGAWHRRDFEGMLNALKVTNWDRLVEILTDLQKMNYKYEGRGMKSWEHLLGFVQKGFMLA